jgi:hypothetical protein
MHITFLALDHHGTLGLGERYDVALANQISSFQL